VSDVGGVRCRRDGGAETPTAQKAVVKRPAAKQVPTKKAAAKKTVSLKREAGCMHVRTPVDWRPATPGPVASL